MQKQEKEEIKKKKKKQNNTTRKREKKQVITVGEWGKKAQNGCVFKTITKKARSKLEERKQEKDVI